jgi:hypothetical protein
MGIGSGFIAKCKSQIGKRCAAPSVAFDGVVGVCGVGDPRTTLENCWTGVSKIVGDCWTKPLGPSRALSNNAGDCWTGVSNNAAVEGADRVET